MNKDLQRILSVILLIFLCHPVLAEEGKTQRHPAQTAGFIENKGQIIDQNNKPNPSVLYLLNMPGMNVQLRRGGFSYDLYIPTSDSLPTGEGKAVHSPAPNGGKPVGRGWEFHRIDFNLLNTNPACEIITSGQSADYANYYTTGTSTQGVKDVHSYQTVTYNNLYSNIDLEFMTDATSEVKYNFVVHPGGKLSSIRMKISDPEIEVNEAGSLLLKTSHGTIEEAIPESHYRLAGADKSVKVRFYQVSLGVYGFLCESPIPTNATLTIDPVPDRLWGSYYGGENLDAFFAGDVDNNGFFYTAGRTSSLVNMATAGSHQENFSGLTDGILVKFNPDGARLWATYYGGADIDLIQGLVITPDLYLMVAGQTASAQNISTPGAFQELLAGNSDAFLVKFDGNGIRIWGTYYGGTLQDKGYSCACDLSGNIFLQGTTRSTDGISTPGSHQPLPGLLDDVFLVKFDASGNRLWGTYYGGECDDYTLLDRSCTTTASGDVYISGSTCSTGAIATAGSFQPVLAGTNTADGFLARFDANGVRQWGTYYGGPEDDRINGIYAATGGKILISGETQSLSGISSSGAFQTTYGGGGYDAFLGRFSEDGTRDWVTYYGGLNDDALTFATTTSDGNYLFGGYTKSTNAISTPSAFQPIYAGGVWDAMLVKFDPSGNRLWGTYYGGEGSDWFYAGACRIGEIYTAGATSSLTGVTTTGAHQTVYGGSVWDGLVVKFTENGAVNINFDSPDTVCVNSPVTITNLTTGGTSFYWNFCSGSATNDPIGANIGNPGNLMNLPTYITLVRQGDECYSFVSCQGVGVIRYFHGTSFTNAPLSWTNLGTFGGLIPFSQEGIQVKQDGTNWYSFVNSVNTLVRLDFGNSLANTPAAVDIGPFPAFDMAHGLIIIKEGETWLGFVTCTTGMKLLRLNFGTSLTNIPIVTDFGNFGGVLGQSTGICIIQENTLWYALVMSGSNTMSRVFFGNSLFNTPTAENLGDPGGFNIASGLTLIRDCETTTGYFTNYLLNGQLGKLSFPTGIGGTVVGTILGNIGGLARPHSFSEIFRENDILYAYITNRDNGTLTRLTFPSCTNASVPSSNLFTPPLYTYDLPGTYHIHLIVDEGLPTMQSLCKPIVAMDPATINLGPDKFICLGDAVTLDAGPLFTSYLWSTGETTRTISVSEAGNYSVTAIRWGCESSDDILVNVEPLLTASITVTTPSNIVCSGTSVTFTANPTNGGANPLLQWLVNGNNVGTGLTTYTYTPTNNDLVTCVLTSSLTCVTGNPATATPINMSVSPNLPAGVTIAATPNPFCAGSPVTMTATAINGGLAPSYQWKLNGADAGTNNPMFIFTPASGDLVTCVMTSSETCSSGNPVSSLPILLAGLPLPVVSFTPCFDMVTTVDARPIKLHGGLPTGGTYSGPGVNTATGVFTPSVAGTGTKTITYSYTNAASCSASQSLEITVQETPAFTCGDDLLDIRDNQVYPTVQIGTQCWMQKNLEFGITIDELIQQTDNCVSEKYTLNSSLLTPNSNYQWDEVMDYDNTPGAKGLCPPGWHIPDESEWSILFSFYLGNSRAGYPLQDPYLNGFKAQQNGVYYLNSMWSFTDFATLFWSSTMADQTRAYAHGMNTMDQSVSVYAGVKANGFSVRCLRD